MSDTDTYRSAVAQLRSIYESRQHDGSLRELLEARDDVIARYQPVFSQANAGRIGRDEVRDFLMFRNNRHWSGLQRLGPAITGNMDSLRDALAELLDESVPVSERLDRLLPEGRARVKKLGKAVLTPVLLVAHPDQYAVWNGTSEAALRELGIWPEFDRGLSVGRQYERLNRLMLEVANAVGVDLWTLDALWWRVVRPDESVAIEEDQPLREDPTGDEARFGLERHLHEFLCDNWENTTLGRNWTLCEEGGDITGYGSERPTPIGKIDLLARHKNGRKWLVIELKRDQTADSTVGQVMRYMGWVKTELAGSGEEVEGLIIGRGGDDKLRYALKVAQGIRFMRYEVDFRLAEDPS